MRKITKKILAASAFALAVFTSNAQVASLYTFSSFQGTYTAITGGTAFTTTSFDDEDIVDPTATPVAVVTSGSTGPGLVLGFNFLFDNIVYDRVAISNNGWIALGQSSLGASAVSTAIGEWSHPISTTSGASAALQHHISPLGTDLLGKSTGSQIRIQTLGTAPTRTTVIQWSNYQKFVAVPTLSDNINFQLKLYETSNIIDAVYGVVTSVSLDSIAEVGLRGGSNADYNNRTVNSTNVWNNSVAGTSNLSAARFNSTLYPAVGLTYRWSLPQCSGAFAAITASASTATVCPGKTFSLSSSPNLTVSGISYSWTSSGSSASGPFTVIPNGGTVVQNSVTIPGTTWFQLNALCITDNSTVSSSVYNVSVFPVPTVTAVASSPSLCSGSSLTLTGIGNASTYVWNGGFTNGVGAPASTTNTFVVTATSALGCTATAAVIVTVVPTPSLAPTVQPTVLCIGSTATYSATGAVSYTWASGSQTVFTPNFSVTPATPGITTYTLTRDNQGCANTQQLSLITYSLPYVFAISSPTVVCAGKPTTLTVAGGINYTWTSPGNPPTVPSFTFQGASPLAFPLVPTIYTVTAHDGTCAATTTVFVAANPNPTILTTANPATLCSGASATINATGGSNYTITSTATSASYNSFPIVETLTTTAAYNVTGDNSFGCTSSVSQIVLVYPNPTLTTVAISNKTLVCSGGAATLSVGGANTYSWSTGVTTQTTLVNPVSSVSGPVIYTVTGTFSNTGCSFSKTVAVSVFIPTVTVTGNTSTCIGGNIILYAGGATNNNYQWATSVGGSTIAGSAINTTINAPAVYTISVLTTSGTAVLCPGSKTIDVNVFFNPTITAVAQRTPICVNESVVLTAGGGDTYLWNTGPNTQTISVHPTISTTYTVTGTDVNGCVSIGTVQVKVSGCTGITEQNAANIGLITYPNPSNGNFIIQSATELRLSLVNDLGQLIRIIELSGANNYQVSVSDLAKGIYFLTGQKDNSQISQKIIVTK